MGDAGRSATEVVEGFTRTEMDREQMLQAENICEMAIENAIDLFEEQSGLRVERVNIMRPDTVGANKHRVEIDATL
jgi:hypothetical protein